MSAAPAAGQPDLPSDRPPFSQPVGAVMSTLWLYLFCGLAVPNTAFAIGRVLPAGVDPIPLAFPLIVAMSATPLLLVVFGMRGGRRWALYILRWAALAGVIAMVIDVAIGLSLATRLIGPGDRAAVLDGEYILIVAAVTAPFGWLLLRGLATVRWLDPRSRPSEWEKPMVSAARRRRGKI